VDDAIETQDDLVNSKPKGTDASDWSHFTERVTVDELFFELTF
jgi:hypothetical protein